MDWSLLEAGDGACARCCGVPEPKAKKKVGSSRMRGSGGSASSKTAVIPGSSAGYGGFSAQVANNPIAEDDIMVNCIGCNIVCRWSILSAGDGKCKACCAKGVWG